jgi:hypothetical protein
MKITFFKKEKSFRKKGFHLNPNVLWKLVLCMGVVIIIVAFVFSFNLFTQINKEFVPSTENTQGQIRIVKKEEIKRVLEYFTERERKSVEILNSPSPLVDPSL